MKRWLLTALFALTLCAGFASAQAAVTTGGVEYVWYTDMGRGHYNENNLFESEEGQRLYISADQGGSYAELPGLREAQQRTGLSYVVAVEAADNGSLLVKARDTWSEEYTWFRAYSAEEISAALQNAVPKPVEVHATNGVVTVGSRYVMDHGNENTDGRSWSNWNLNSGAYAGDRIVYSTDGVTWLPAEGETGLSSYDTVWWDGAAFRGSGGEFSTDGIHWENTGEEQIDPSFALVTEIGPYRFEVERGSREVYLVDRDAVDVGVLMPHLGQAARVNGIYIGKIRAWYGPDDTVTVAVYDIYARERHMVSIDYPFSSLDWCLENLATRFRTVEEPPREELPREEAAPAIDGEVSFIDVPDDAWFAPYVNYVAQQGIMLGRGEGRFAPGDTLTGQECLTLAVRLYDLQHGGDGVLKSAPADYGWISMTTADGTETGGYADDWDFYAPITPMGINFRYFFYIPLDTEEKMAWGREQEGKPASMTLDGTEWTGTAAIYVIPETHQVAADMTVLETYPEKHLLYVDFSRGEGKQSGPTYPDLSDIRANRPGPQHWYRDAAYAAHLYGLDDNFDFSHLIRKDLPASREEFALCLAVAAGEMDKINAIGDLPDLTRKETTEGIYTLYEAGILTGTDDYGTFDANKTLTRAEAAAMAARVLDPTLRLEQPLTPLPLREHTLTPVELDGWSTGVKYAGVAADWMPVYRTTQGEDADGQTTWNTEYAIYRADGVLLDLEGGQAYEGEYPGALGTTGYAVVRKFNEETKTWEYGVYNVTEGTLEVPYGSFSYIPQARAYITEMEGEQRGDREVYERLGYGYGYAPDHVNLYAWDGLIVDCAGGRYLDEATLIRAAEPYQWVGPLNDQGQGFAYGTDGVLYRIDFASTSEL